MVPRHRPWPTLLTGLSGGVNASFSYDALGRRREKTIGSTTTAFLYDGQSLVQELVSGTPSVNYLTGLGIDEVFSRSTGSATEYYLSDILGSVVALADTNGTVQTSYTYAPFGEASSSGSSSDNRLSFTGREDDGTGLYYYRARYYQPEWGRFISEDPIGFAGGDVNLYAYVWNSPTNYVDPSGQNPIFVGCGVGAVLGAIGFAWYESHAGRKVTFSDFARGAAAGCAVGAIVGGGWMLVAGGAAVGGGGAAGGAVGLSAAAARYAVTTGTGLQHGFRHVHRQLGLGNWDNSTKQAFQEIVEGVLTWPQAVVRNWTMSRGGQVVDIYLKRVNGEWLAISVNKAGEMVTAVIPSSQQLANWGVVP